MSIIKIPQDFTQTDFQEIDMSTCKRSKFQIDRLLEISKQDDFHNFVCCQDQKKLWVVFPEFSGPFTCLWMDKAEVLHAERIGRRRVLKIIK